MHIQNLDDGSILLTAPVMIPGVPDCDYNRGEPPLTREQVRNFAESYERYQFVDSEHEITKTGRKRGVKKESFILEADKSFELFDGSTQVYPGGTWMMTSHVTDPEAIQNARDGLYTGYSPAVRSRETADEYLEALKSERFDDAVALKSFSSGGLIKDIPDPVVLSVSLVRKPCQTGSKICKIKNGDTMSDDSTILAKIRGILGDAENMEVEALKSQVDTLESAIEELKSDNAEALKSMKEELITSFTESLKEFADKSREDKDEEDEETNPEDENSDSGDEGTNPEDEDEEEEEVDDDKGSKQGKTHNNKNADKSQEDLDTYEFLGRNPDGTRKTY